MNVREWCRTPLVGKKHALGILLIFVITISGVAIYLFTTSTPPPKTVSGSLLADDTWSGPILVENNVIVPDGIELTILPGTHIEFKHYRGYKGPMSPVGLIVNGGAVKAIGRADAPILFTSDAEEPINGDWGGITITNSDDSEFKYVIVEFSIIGIEQLYSSVNVSHSIIRWTNTEGLYAENSNPVFEYNLFYSNGFHDVALEQYNYDVFVQNNIFQGGHSSVHIEATEVTIKNNYFVNYTDFAVTGGGNVTVVNNKFEHITGTEVALVFIGTGSVSGNDVDGNGTVSIPILDIHDIGAFKLDYVPGDPEDQYLYVFDTVDETRRIIKRLDQITTFGSSLAYANGLLWRFDHRSCEVGLQQDFVSIDPDTQEVRKYGNNIIYNPRTLCYDGTNFWTYDFESHYLYKFTLNDGWVVILESYYKPGLSHRGLTSDGTYLYSPAGQELIKMDMNGNIIENVTLSGGSMGPAITWTGTYFWSYSGSCLTKWYSNGTLAGKIYPIAVETTDLTWDGSYLWSLQKTCEYWNHDGKIFQIEIIDDQYLMGIT